MANGETLTVEARPGAFELDPARAAVIVVDMQNDFAAEQGLFGLAGVDLAPVDAAVAPTAAVLAAARRAGIPVVYIKTGFDAELADRPLALREHPRQSGSFASVGQTVTAPDGSESRVLIEGTWNTEVVDELAPAPDDRVVWKHRYSGFYGTDLEQVLAELGVTDLVFTGCTTSVCVDSTLKDAMFRDFRCLLVEDCCGEPIGAGFERTNHEATVLAVETVLGWVTGSGAVVDALGVGGATKPERPPPPSLS